MRQKFCTEASLCVCVSVREAKRTKAITHTDGQRDIECKITVYHLLNAIANLRTKTGGFFRPLFRPEAFFRRFFVSLPMKYSNFAALCLPFTQFLCSIKMGFKCIHKNINVTAHSTRMGPTTERKKVRAEIKRRRRRNALGTQSPAK